MGMSSKAPAQKETKQFLVDCDGCSFERTATGRDEATQIGIAHRRATGHELVAIEMPSSVRTS